MAEHLEPQEKGYDILVQDDWVLVRAHPGTLLTEARICGMLTDLYSLEAYRSEKKAGLWDFRGCRTDLTSQQINNIREYIQAKYDPGWSHKYTAIVAADDLAFGLARMYELVTDLVPTEKRVFRNREQAEQWIREKIR